MKGYKTYIFIIVVLLTLYIIAELNRPKEFDWTVTLRNDDSNPFGTFILFKEINQLFANASVYSHREPVYNVLHDKDNRNSAYLLIAPSLDLGKTDLDELLHYAENGGFVFLAASQISKNVLDTIGLKQEQFFKLIENDFTSVNLVNPQLKAATDYRFKKGMVDEYFSAIHKPNSTVLGINNYDKPDFVKVQYGKGSFLVHASPLCFSNYFMLFNNNHEYVAKVLSYINSSVSTLHWDEYYKAGRTGPETPLRFFLSNEFLRWALWLAVAAFLLYVFFEMKRKQRIIPVIEPLRNTTLDFVETVSSVYYSQHDNNSIAQKKIQYWQDFIRSRYYLSTQNMDYNFIEQLSRKSGIMKDKIEELIHQVRRATVQPRVTDDTLLALNRSIDEFYKFSKM